MARPQKEGMDYFPHDTDASTDKKIEALRALHGNDGYAFYFIILEQIYKEPTFELLVSDAETGEEMMQILARKVAVTTEKFKQILTTALKWDCFDKDLYAAKGVLTSKGIKKRALVVQEKRDKMRVKYQQAKTEVSDAETWEETREETPQSKVKEKESKSKGKEEKCTYADYVSMTEEEYTKLITQFGTQGTLDRIERLNLYKGSTGKKYANDYLTILAWERKKKETVDTRSAAQKALDKMM